MADQVENRQGQPANHHLRRRETALTRSRKLELLDHARIPIRYRDAKISRAPGIASFSEALSSNLESGRGLFLTGPHDTGKTETLCALCCLALEHEVRVMYVSAPDLLLAVQQQRMFAEHETMEATFRDRVLLAIDDLGAEITDSRGSRQTIVNLVRQRVNAGKATIIATSLREDELAAEYGYGLMALLQRGFTFVQSSSAGGQGYKTKSPRAIKQSDEHSRKDLNYEPDRLNRAIEKRHDTNKDVMDFFGAEQESTVSRWRRGKNRMNSDHAKKYVLYSKVLDEEA